MRRGGGSGTLTFQALTVLFWVEGAGGGDGEGAVEVVLVVAVVMVGVVFCQYFFR